MSTIRLVRPFAGLWRRVAATRWRTRVLVLLALVLVGPVAVVGIIYALPPRIAVALGKPVLAFLSDAPPLPRNAPAVTERSMLLAADGSEIATLFGDVNRVRVNLEDVPKVAVDALLAAEDDRFYDHPGIDHRGVIRAVIANLRAGSIEQGGSTLTQQLARNVYLDASKTARRKLTEAWYALELEDRYSKDEILQRYLNETYFGQGAYGIGAAAEVYFDKPVSDLDVAEATVLVGLIPAPSQRDPVDHPTEAREARDHVLERMAETGRLPDAVAQRHKERELRLDYSPPPPPAEPFFVEYVRRQLLEDPRFDDALGTDRSRRERLVVGGGLRVHTTLDPQRQELANDAIEDVMGAPRSSPLASVVTVEPDTGAVLTMAVGPKSFGRCKAGASACPRTMVNPTAPGMGGSGRQPGSAFKPFVLTAALGKGVPPGWEERTDDGAPIKGCTDNGEPYAPQNYSEDPGIKDMAEAVRVSNNVYHAKLAALLQPETLVDAAQRVGIKNAELPEQCSLALGSGSVFPLDMASAYATFANDGVHCEPNAITRIELGAAAGGGDERYKPRCEPRMEDAHARRMNALLQEPVEGGTATAAQLDRPVAGKTGTTDDYKDAWFIGYVPQLSTSVWVGYERPRVLRNVLGEAQVTGGSIPARLWATYMSKAVRDLEVQSFEAPPEVEPVPTPRWIGSEARDIVEEFKDTYQFNVELRRVRSYRREGTVVRQQPKPGTNVEPGTLVTLRVSDGEGAAPRVPDVVGLPREDAGRVLRRAEYQVRVRVQRERLEGGEQPTARNDTVIRQQPRPGTRAKPGTVVTIVVVEYERQSGTERPTPLPPDRKPGKKPEPSPSPSPSPQPGGDASVEISAVVAAPPGDDLRRNGGEYVTLTAGDLPVDVSGWTIEHDQGGILRIGEGYQLQPGESVDVFTASGNDRPPRRYFNDLAQEVLADDGGLLTVRDRDGRVVTRRRY